MRVRRLAHLDALSAEDGTVVLHGELASLLTPISAAIWNALDESTWIELDVLSVQLADEFGPPPTAKTVPKLLTELVEAGLVELESCPPPCTRRFRNAGGTVGADAGAQGVQRP